jgi:uncharacterized protein YraI
MRYLLLLAALALPLPSHAAYVCTRDPNSSVNLRATPSTRASSKGSIPFGQWVDTSGARMFDGARGWVWVNYYGVTGWIATDYLSNSLDRCGNGL